MIDNIIPFNKPAGSGVISTADRLLSMSRKAEVDPEKFKYMILMTASGDLDQVDWVMAGHPSLVMLLGLVETVKADLHQLIRETQNDG